MREMTSVEAQDAFHTAARPLYSVCRTRSKERQERILSDKKKSDNSDRLVRSQSLALGSSPEARLARSLIWWKGPYYILAGMLGADSLWCGLP